MGHNLRTTAERRVWRADARRTAGIVLSSGGKRISGALLEAFGRGFDAQPQVAAAASIEVPDETAAKFRAVSQGNGRPCELAAELVPLEVEVLGRLLDEAGLGTESLLAVAAHDPGVWQTNDRGPWAYQGLSDAARLAQATGLPVIDAFPATDLAHGGLGGPVPPLAEWLLVHEPLRTRVLVELGRTVRLSYFPAGNDAAAAGRVLAFDVGPGTHLLDLLVTELTGSELQYDVGGRLAVQGKRIPELLDHWLGDPYFERPLPRWSPYGVAPHRFLHDSIRMAIDAGWSVQDVLCTATHFLAETLARAIRRRLPPLPKIDEVLITGGGQRNGMLLAEIRHRLDPVPLVRLGEVGMPESALRAASVAVLGLLFIDQVPGNQTGITGTGQPRVLGRVTPGSPQHWHRLLREMAAAGPTTMSLRSAV